MSAKEAFDSYLRRCVPVELTSKQRQNLFACYLSGRLDVLNEVRSATGEENEPQRMDALGELVSIVEQEQSQNTKNN